MPNYSPIRKLFDFVLDSPYRVAPAGSDRLRKEIQDKGITFEFAEDDRVTPKSRLFAEYVVARKAIRISDGYLEAIWAASNLYLRAFNAYGEAQAAGHDVFELGTDPSVRDAWVLYVDRLESLTAGVPWGWPENATKPIRRPYEFTVNYAVNELFLVAAAWTLHHELAHGRLGHQEESDNPRKEEHQADTEATEKVCEAPASPDELTKRTLGVAAAVLVMIGREVRARRRLFEKHPPTYERLLNTLAVSGIPDDHITYAVAFVILDIHLTEAGLTDDLNRDKESFRDLCFEVCDILRAQAIVPV